ncbi:uncharacterized protein [Amphiura filiformis]|uniref:uncharacterized protein n=1 Tax=Amphiura filiformis TaxID=82378 RepID=UPI003B227F7B
MTTEGRFQLPVSGAIIEIVEYLLAINQEVQYGVKSSKKQHIEVEVISKDKGADTGDSFRLHRFKVTQRKLCRWFDVDGFLSSMVPDVLQVIPPETHRKGDPDSTQGFFITCPQKDNTTGQPEHHCVTVDQCGRICTDKSSVPTTSASAETSVVLQVMLSQDTIANEIYTIYQYLHKLRIVNMQLSMKLMICIDEEGRTWNFGEDLHGYKYRTGDLKMSTDIGHYLRSSSIPSHAVKIKPSIGTRLIISSPPVWDDRQVPLKLSVVASIIPPPACQNDFRNGHCKELWISFLSIFIFSFARQDYGLTLGDAALPPTNSQDLQVYEADRRYQLSVVQEEDAQDSSTSHIIQLFIVLTRNDKNKPLAFHERQG